MKKQNTILIMLALTFTLALPNMATAQQNEGDKTTREKNSEKFREHRAAIKAIQNDATLTEAQKEALITEKNGELREQIGRTGSASRGSKKGKFASEEAREEWKKNKEAINKEIEAIENDPNLTDEEKEIKKREFLNEKLGEKRRKGKKGGAYKNMTEDERKIAKEKREAIREERRTELKAVRAERKSQYEAIQNDPDLTEEEKAAKKKELREEGKKITRIKARERNMKRGKGPHKEMTKQEWKEKHGERGIAKKELSKEQKEKALASLEKNEERLAKNLKNGKISQERYDSRIAKIKEVRKTILEK